ncbi:TolC family protein [Faecalibacter macacae]|uniref:TolC family protein n=1 Tax=Faecalibacter macacae TaxID=1859289 RepID=A0A3L9MBS4_9FLAO|nr:TolC family protein [Faecalibacter macacae]RLZ10647.1 TolC family protein [Faecalibacter macacae]
MVLTSVKYQLLLCALFLSIQAFSQKDNHRFSLNDAIEIGMNNNKILQINSINEQVAITKEKDLKMEKLPDIDFKTGFKVLGNIRQFESGFLHPATKYEVPREQYNFTLSAEIPIYLGGRLKNDEKKAEIETEISKLKTKKTGKDLRLEIITGFLQVRHIEDQQELLREKMHEDSVNIHHIDALRKNGVVTNNEVLRAKLQLSNHKMAFTELDNQIAIVEHQIKTLISFPEHEEFHITTKGLITDTELFGFEEQLVEEAYDKNEALEIAKKDISIKNIEKKIVRANQLPTITGGGEYGYSYPNFMFFPPVANLYRFGAVGFSVKVPLANFYKNKEKMAIASEKINIAKLEVEEKEEQIRNDVFRATRLYQEAIEKIEIAKEAMEQAKENYRIVKLKYANQLSLITELIDADNAYLEAESQMISLQINKQLKYYQLQYILGNI